MLSPQNSTCLRCRLAQYTSLARGVCSFTTSQRSATQVESRNDASMQPSPPPSTTSTEPLNPETTWRRKDEKELARQGISPIGSRRRRAVLSTAPAVAFEQLPYQCFQEARKILALDREQKLRQIEIQRARIARLPEGTTNINVRNQKQEMEKYLEHLKVQADINDPLVKRRFEDGLGDMNRPVYRFLADRKWRSYQRKLLMQRLEQMHIMPDILPKIDPVAEVLMRYDGKKVDPGEFVLAKTSQHPPSLRVQLFDRGQKKITIALVNPDVPNQEKDGFDFRCHYLAANFVVSPTQTQLSSADLAAEDNVILPWLPAWSQKGLPYQRLSVLVLEQPEGKDLDIASLKNEVHRDGFMMRSFVGRHKLRAIGAHLFRTQWDETTDQVMAAHGIEGADVYFKRKSVERLPYKKKDGARYR